MPKPTPRRLIAPLFVFALTGSFAAALIAEDNAIVPQGIRPVGADGVRLNLDFETGTLEHWVASGDAFRGQPIKGDTVGVRRAGMHSGHTGDFWIGTFEVGADRPKGTLTSAPFKVTHRWASFLVGGGMHLATQVELVRSDLMKTFFRVSGSNDETMKYVVVDLEKHQGKDIFIRIVDRSSGGWGHINFDDFLFHEDRPQFPDERIVPPLDEFVHAGLSPKEAADAMSVPNGFTVTSFAGEPDVKQPIAMAIDDRGRLWVAEGYSYPIRVPEKEARDRILIFEDTDGDGRFDNRTVFVDNLNLVSGLEVGFGGVWVGAAPQFLFIPDRDGDDKPDGPPEVLLDGWGYHDTHETLNAFIWGPDGWLYGCHGVFTYSNVGPPGTPKDRRVPLNAAIWRYHPTRHQFEIFAHGTSNPWGVDFNDMGQAFCTACVIPHLYHVIQGARYERQAGNHFNRHTYDDIKTIADHRHYVGAWAHSGNGRSDSAGGGHAHCGAMIYLGGQWPEQYRNQIFMNNIHGARLNMDLLKRSGSGYVGSHGPDFLMANDSWSQIINIRYGPDGQAYFIDWYDNNQCHRRETDVHDRNNGRIFKISYGATNHVPVDLGQQSDLELARLQTHKNDWFVRHARRILQQRAAADGIAVDAQQELVRLATEEDLATRRLRGMWALHVTGNLTEELTLDLLADESEYVRGWAIQCALEMGPPSSAVHKKMVGLAAADPSPSVRLYLASALQRMPLDDRRDILAHLVAHGEDDGDHNLPLMYWYAAEPLAGEEPAEALELAVAARIPLLLSYTVRRIGSDASEESLALLVDGLNKVGDAEAQLTILKGINQALVGRRRVEMPKLWPGVSVALSKSTNQAVHSEANALAVTFGDPRALAEMRKLLADPSVALAARRGALESLLKTKDRELAPTLQRLIADESLRSEALRGLAVYDDPATPRVVLKGYANFSPSHKRDALNTLASRTGYADALLDALEEKLVATRDVSSDVIRQLRNLKDEKLEKRIGLVWGKVQDTPADKVKLIAKYTKLLSKPTREQPDTSLGRAVFAKTCQQCHTLFGTGSKVGPELTGSNRANLEYVLTNVLDPSSLIAKDYTATTIATTDGRVATGIVRGEDSASLTIQTANETLVIPRDEIDEMQPSTKSMMPDDIFKPLKETEVRALVAYLANPSQVPMLATEENVKGFFNGVDLTGWHGNPDLWSVEEGQIVGRSSGLKRNEFLQSDLAAGDFHLTLEVKLVGNHGNSGIQFRSSTLPDGHVKGYQADMGAGWWGKLYEEHGRALLWKTSGKQHVKSGEWNRYEIIAAGSRIRTLINGNLCVDLNDPPGAKRGIFALQLHSGPATEVRFRNIELKLDPKIELAEKP